MSSPERIEVRRDLPPNPVRTRRRFEKIGIGVTVVGILLAAFLAVGFTKGWFKLSWRGEGPDAGQVDVNLTIDSAKIQRDAAEVVEEAEKLGQAAQVVAELQTTEGTVTRVDVPARALTLTTDDQKTVVIHVDTSAQITVREGQGALANLRPGDKVAVVHRTRNEERRAEKITLLTPAGN